MRRIAIQDANILIDLVKTGLFDYCMRLQYQFSSTDIILDELYPDQQDIIRPHIASGRFTIIQISASELAGIVTINQEDPRLSPQDCSALFYALEKNCILITGDKRMRDMAKNRTIEYYGVFWLLDQLVENEVLSKQTAFEFLEKLKLVNRRLPLEEFEKRKKDWR